MNSFGFKNVTWPTPVSFFAPICCFFLSTLTLVKWRKNSKRNRTTCSQKNSTLKRMFPSWHQHGFSGANTENAAPKRSKNNVVSSGRALMTAAAAAATTAATTMKLGGQKIRGNERPPTDKLDLTLTRYYNKFTPIAVWKKVARKHIEREDQGGKNVPLSFVSS